MIDTRMMDRLRALNTLELEVQGALKAYFQDRIEDHYRALEQAADLHKVGKAQGSIEELKKFLLLLEELKKPRGI